MSFGGIGGGGDDDELWYSRFVYAWSLVLTVFVRVDTGSLVNSFGLPIVCDTLPTTVESNCNKRCLSLAFGSISAIVKAFFLATSFFFCNSATICRRFCWYLHWKIWAHQIKKK